MVTLQSGAQGQACDRYIPALSPPPVEAHFSRAGGCKGLKTWGEGGSGSREVRRDAIPAGMPAAVRVREAPLQQALPRPSVQIKTFSLSS